MKKPKPSIVWLASYPKSGNTWLRAFLFNYIANGDRPIPINQLHRLGMGDAITKAYQQVDQAPLDPDNSEQVLRRRGAVLQGIQNSGADVNFVKTHHPNRTIGGYTVIPPQRTRAGIYLVRNPLDVTVSYAAHYEVSLAQAVSALCADNTVIHGDERSVIQYLGNWADHVRSWSDQNACDVLTLRYEDLLARPEDLFASVLEHLGIPIESQRVAKAVRFCCFEELKTQERKAGFIEKSPSQEAFFRSGQAGNGKHRLSVDQIRQLRDSLGEVMARFDYA